MDSLEITTLDIAKFFKDKDIGINKRADIMLDLWSNKNKYLEYYMYENFRTFTNEVNNLLMDLLFNNVLLNEINPIIKIQDGLESKYVGYGLYKINKNKTESFLKQCKLRLMYNSKTDYIYMKMRTLVKGCGYKRRNNRMMQELNRKLLKLELYISDGFDELSPSPRNYTRSIEDLEMDEFIRIYSY